MSFGIGIIGAGTIGTKHAEEAVKAGLRIAGICDVRRDRAESMAAKYPGAFATTELEDLLSRPGFSAVIVATPNAYHKRVAVVSMLSGMDVLLEKPMALSASECDEIIAARNESGKLLQVGFVSRYAPAAMEVRKLVNAGKLGRIYHAKAALYRRRGIPGLGRWFTTKALSGGGVLMDLGSHLIDLVLFLTGSPVPTSACAACAGTFGMPIGKYRFTEMWAGPPAPDGVFDVEDSVSALVRFEDGMTLELNVTWAANLPQLPPRDGFLLLGDRAGCFMSPWDGQVIVTTERGGQLADERMRLTPDDSWAVAWANQTRTFARNVTGRAAPEASAEAGRTVQAIIDAMYSSAESGTEEKIHQE